MTIVLDTNVLYAGLRSRDGASFQVLQRIRSGRFDIALSVGVLLEYEEVLKLKSAELGLTIRDIDDVIDYLCSVSRLQEVFFLWRPYLTDADDDMLLELAVAAGCDAIVTFNTRDFAGSQKFGVRVLTPPQFLREIEP